MVFNFLFCQDIDMARLAKKSGSRKSKRSFAQTHRRNKASGRFRVVRNSRGRFVRKRSATRKHRKD
jgi:hypothetical protein